MTRFNPFDQQQVQESAYARPDGLMEQLGLPPALICFLRANRRAAWTATGFLVAVVVVVSLYGSYRDYRTNKANAALHQAIRAPENERQEKLSAVSKKFSSTGAGRWSRVELAMLALDKGEDDHAIDLFLGLQKEVGAKDPLYPLITSRLAALYESAGKTNEAISSYQELQNLPGFSLEGSFQLGRLYEDLGRKEEARAAYEKFLQNQNEKGGKGKTPLVAQPSDPMTILVQSRLNRLSN